MKKHNFNLVEIIIAMGIVIVCVTTIMGMFSVGMKISQEATIKTYANLVFEQLGGLVEVYPNAKEQIPTITTVHTSKDARFADTGDPNAATIFKPTITADDQNLPDTWSSIKTAEDACDKSSNGAAIDPQDPFFKNVYYNSSLGSNKLALLKVEFQTSVNSSDVVDAVIWARMWFETDATAAQIDTSDGGSFFLDEELYIELTWPDKIPYNNRILSGQVILKKWVLEP